MPAVEPMKPPWKSAGRWRFGFRHLDWNHAQTAGGICRLQDLADMDAGGRRLLKMFANLLEGHCQVKEPRNRLTIEEYE